MNELQAWETIGERYHTDWRKVQNLCDNVYFLGSGKFPSVSPSLTDDQQEVLEWLQIYADKDSGDKPLQTIWYFLDLAGNNGLGLADLKSFQSLNREQQFQVLAAFAEWGCNQ